LGRFARVHKAYAHIISFSRLALFIAVFFSVYVLRNSLLGFGDSVLKSVEGTVVGDWLKPVRGLAGMLASLVKRVWKADITPDTLSNALFCALVLLGATVLWWTIFRAFWLSRCAARSRKACRGGDVLNKPFASVGFFVLCIAFLCLGCLPLIILAAAPGLTVATVGKAIAVTLSAFALIFGLFFAVCLPVGMEQIWQDRDKRWYQRISSVPASFMCIAALLSVAGWLWPWKISPAVQTAVLVVFVMAMALGWQVYGILKVRKDSRLIWGAIIITLPILGAASCFWLRFSQPYFSAVLTYFGLAAAVLISIFCLRYFKIITA
jgi:hypothetical protein